MLSVTATPFWKLWKPTKLGWILEVNFNGHRRSIRKYNFQSHEETDIVFINHFCIGTFNDNYLQSYS